MVRQGKNCVAQDREPAVSPLGSPGFPVCPRASLLNAGSQGADSVLRTVRGARDAVVNETKADTPTLQCLPTKGRAVMKKLVTEPLEGPLCPQ